MPDLSSSTWAESDAANIAPPPNGWPEGQPPSTVNDCGRMVMGALKRFWRRVNAPLATGGTAAAWTLAYDVAPAAYVTGERFGLRAPATSTGAATLDVNGLGAKAVKKMTTDGKADLAAGDVQGGQPVTLEYDGTHFVVVSPLATTVTAGATLALKAALDEASVTLAAAPTLAIGAAPGNHVLVTGTGAVTAFDTAQAGARRTLVFGGALTLTHDAAVLILPGASNIAAAAGDVATFVSEGAGKWRCIAYTRAGKPPAFSAYASASTSIANTATAKIAFGTEEIDIGGHFDPATSRYTPPAGTYAMTAAVNAAGTAPGTTWQASIYRNGAVLRRGALLEGANAGGILVSTVSAIVVANGTDYFEIYGTNSNNTNGSVATTTGASATWFQAVRVSD